jgi:hypothetical protein
VIAVGEWTTARARYLADYCFWEDDRASATAAVGRPRECNCCRGPTTVLGKTTVLHLGETAALSHATAQTQLLLYTNFGPLSFFLCFSRFLFIIILLLHNIFLLQVMSLSGHLLSSCNYMPALGGGESPLRFSVDADAVLESALSSASVSVVARSCDVSVTRELRIFTADTSCGSFS